MRIVYVEDNDANLTLVRKVLEATGDMTVVGAQSAEEGLVLLSEAPPDVLLLDLDLPGMSGLDLARQLRADPSLAELPIVAISASVMKDERAKALEAGCSAFVEKPFDIRRLREIVRAAANGTLD
ncbi:MAG: response regulator [Nannocystaceae bacterium]|nr:response regulator [Nannocystaceae bacterium]